MRRRGIFDLEQLRKIGVAALKRMAGSHLTMGEPEKLCLSDARV